MKYVDTLVSFSEIPDEITLCINISNCPNKCKGCHSPWLQENIGIELNNYELYDIINKNSGISCVCFMGGDSNPEEINDLAIKIKSKNLKVGWYSGKSEISDKINIKNFDYIKIGPYLKDKGPLSDKNTNQKMYKIIHFTGMNSLKDITYKFWK
jgi:anaerobic ribonucleoside-triphosphate reductase activating protein